MSEFMEAIDETIGKGWRKVFFAIVGLVAFWIIISLVLGMWPFSSAAGVVKQVTSPNAIIQNYQWYYDQYNSIQAQKANLATMGKEAEEYRGTKMVLNNMIGEYNSRSKQITRNLWKASDLPYQIQMEE
jgi:hypothetical protein